MNNIRNFSSNISNCYTLFYQAEIKNYFSKKLDKLRSCCTQLDTKQKEKIKKNLEKLLPHPKKEGYEQSIESSCQQIARIYVSEEWIKNKSIKQFAHILLKTMQAHVVEKDKKALKKLGKQTKEATTIVIHRKDALEQRIQKLSSKRKGAKRITQLITAFLSIAPLKQIDKKRSFIHTYINSSNIHSEKQRNKINKILKNLDFARILAKQPTCPLKKTDLHVVEIDESGLDTLKTHLFSWHTLNKQLRKVIHMRASNLPPEKRRQIGDSSVVVDNILLTLENMQKKISTTKKYVWTAHDSQHNEQGVAIAKIDEKYMTLKLLATHPANLGILAHQNYQIKGVGTALLTHLAKIALEKQLHSIQLDCTDSALPWYTHLGFTKGEHKFLQLDSQGMQQLVNK